jgi:hypothetical protein
VWVPGLLTWLAPALALGRVGGGEHFDSGRADSGGGDGGLLEMLLWLVFNAPCVGIPLLLAAIGYFLYRRTQGESSTRAALDLAEAERRTAPSSTHVVNWVGALQAKDPAFELLPMLDRARRQFLELQAAWFVRDLAPVRSFLSDGLFQRLSTQLGLLAQQGLRDAAVDARVLDLQLVGLEQTPGYDTVHLRVTATLRDTDVSADTPDEDARLLAQRCAPERFIEVWSFLRRPGVSSLPGAGEHQGACPNCGAPFSGGAANRCEHCQAIVNSGAYDWVVAEITQGSEYAVSPEIADGLARARQTDAALSTEILEDRASLLFWRWVDARSRGEPRRLAKLATAEFLAGLEAERAELESSGGQLRFLECAVGAAHTRALTLEGPWELAQVELRWSARIGRVARGGKATTPPTQPQRSVMVLQRRAGASTSAEHGLATNRCPRCSAPLTDNGQASCEYCGAALESGDADWVLRGIVGWEAWLASAGRGERPTPVAARVPDREERERLVYTMAALAAADGVIDRRERALLQMTADRWRVPFANVELALSAGPGLVDKLLARGSLEAEVFMRELVAMALIDGRVDLTERKMLEAAASHLGMGDRLEELLARPPGRS